MLPRGPITLDFQSWFHKNCKRQRRQGAKICQSCPFREVIEWLEEGYEKNMFCVVNVDIRNREDA
jgi:hypothetical protein